MKDKFGTWLLNNIVSVITLCGVLIYVGKTFQRLDDHDARFNRIEPIVTSDHDAITALREQQSYRRNQ